MKDVVQAVLMRFALAGLAVSLAALALRSRTVRDVQSRLLSAWRGLSTPGRFAALAFLLVGVIYGGGKTNEPPRMLPGPRTAPVVPDAEWKAANWNLRGAWKDSFWLDFPGGWVFPHGTNHLRGVEVLSRGLLWPSPFDTNAVASVGVPVEIVPGLSSFDFGFTPSNTCRFAWTDAAVGRNADDLVTAEIELFRNGDVLVVTNGVPEFFPRELPFPHDGYGQDDEWVSANFTNATEIASAGGYAAWVDAQVGEGLTNGLYKLTVSVVEAPPEATLVSVGDVSVTITNAGDYVFLLEKGRRYDLSASSDCATNFAYSAVDDVAATPRSNDQMRNLLGDGNEDGVWHSSPAEQRLFAPFGFVAWDPTLEISPRKWHPARANATRTFTAVLTDVPWGASPTYAWSSANGNVCSCADSSSQSATFTCHFPAADGNDVSLSLDVTLEFETLHAEYLYHIGEFDEAVDYEEEIEDFGELSPNLVVSASPSVVFFEAGTPNTDSSDVGCYYLTTEPGTFELAISGDAVSVTDSGGATVTSGYTWSADGGVVGARHFSVGRTSKSTSPSGTSFAVTFAPAYSGASAMTDAASVTFVEWKTETVATWPNDRNRKTIGVCEAVNITMDPYMQNAEPNKTSAGSSLQKRSNGRWLYRASLNQAEDEIFVPGFGELFSFNVITPIGYDATLKTIEVSTNCIPGISGGYAMLFDLVVLPTNVSFYAIRIKEVGMTSTNAVGYFAEPRNAHFLTHSAVAGSGAWSVVYKGNKCFDKAQMAELPPPWGGGGSMTWPIPNEYTGNAGSLSGVLFCNTDQHFSVDSVGTSHEEKFGWFAEVSTNRVFSYGRTTTP